VFLNRAWSSRYSPQNTKTTIAKQIEEFRISARTSIAQPRLLALSIPTNRPAVENPGRSRKLAFGPAAGTVQHNRVVGALAGLPTFKCNNDLPEGAGEMLPLKRKENFQCLPHLRVCSRLAQHSLLLGAAHR
jgi:hypothetical protein